MNLALLLLLVLLGVFRIVAVKWLLLVFLAMLLFGCAGREPSSTDFHNRVPLVSCTDVKYQGRYHHMCCEGETCAFSD